MNDRMTGERWLARKGSPCFIASRAASLSLAAVAWAALAFAAPAEAQRGGGGRGAQNIPVGTPGGPIYTAPTPALDISGVWWTESYSPKIQIVGGGALPYNDKGKAEYAKNMAALKDGSIVDEARHLCVPDGIPRILGNPYPFKIIETPGQTTISIRGIAPVGPGATVATYIDDAPVGSSSAYGGGVAFQLDLLPYDVQRLEVLRGPQGTLYGASSMGGLLKYVLTTPSLDEFHVNVGGDVFGMSNAGEVGGGGLATDVVRR